MDGSLQAALFEALDAIRAHYPEQGVSMCNELLTAYPDAVRVLRVRAQAYEGMQDWQHASEDYTRVLDTVPTDGNSMVSLAQSMHKLGRTGEAQLIARQALDYVPTSEDALILAQNVEDGEPNALKPPIPGRVLALRQQFDFGRVSKALESLRKFAAARPHRVDARVVLAELLWRSGARISAAELCQAILDELPDCLPAHTLLAIIWKNVGAVRVADAHLRLLDRLDPDHRETREWLGDLSPVRTVDVPARPDPALQRLSDTDEDDLTNAAFTQAEHDEYMNDLIANSGPIGPMNPYMDGGESDDDSSDNDDDEVAGNNRIRRSDEDDDVLDDVTPLTWVHAATDGSAPPKPWWLNKLEEDGPPVPEGLPLVKGNPASKNMPATSDDASASGNKEADTLIEAWAEDEVADGYSLDDVDPEDAELADIAAIEESDKKDKKDEKDIDPPHIEATQPDAAKSKLSDLAVTEEITIIAPAGIDNLGKQSESSLPATASAPSTPTLMSRPERRIWQQGN